MRPLSKSKIIAFRQCPKRLWLEIHHPELREDSADTLHSFQIGHQVGDAARSIYDANGQGALIDVASEGYDAAFARSAQLLAQSRDPIFEAGLKTEGALAFADVMLPVMDKQSPAWKMIEVKSATKVKDYYLDDIAVQTFIAQAAGVKLKAVALACIDTSWVYPGGADYQGLLYETDLTEEAFARTEEVRGWLAEAQKVAASSTEPDITVGAHCHEPFECGFCHYCTRDVPQPEHSIDCLPRFSGAKREKLAAEGITELREVSDDLLNDQQRLVKKHTLAGTAHFDAVGAAADLAPHGWPAYFLDFETIQFPVPIWKGTRPYQQIPFQFSVHTLLEAGALSQIAFLDLSGQDPSHAFAKALIAGCGNAGPVFVYNAAFERTRIRELSERFPDLAHALLAINERVVDLLPIARKRYYNASQKGSWSIKAVLPAAVPELSYDKLAGVKDGNMAMSAFCEAIRPDTAAVRKAEIEKELLAYCRLDTFAMVRLWQVFNGRNEPAFGDK